MECTLQSWQVALATPGGKGPGQYSALHGRMCSSNGPSLRASFRAFAGCYVLSELDLLNFPVAVVSLREDRVLSWRGINYHKHTSAGMAGDWRLLASNLAII